MERDYEPALAGDEILSEEDTGLAAWTLDDLDTVESADWAAMGDD